MALLELSTGFCATMKIGVRRVVERVSFKAGRLVGLQEIEGVAGSHKQQVDWALKLRQEALEYVADVHRLAEFIGGKVESLWLREDWAISKELFPGVQVFFIFNRASDELPCRLSVLYSGDRVRLMKSEDLAAATILLENHMLRYVNWANPGKDLPEVCGKV